MFCKRSSGVGNKSFESRIYERVINCVFFLKIPVRILLRVALVIIFLLAQQQSEFVIFPVDGWLMKFSWEMYLMECDIREVQY